MNYYLSDIRQILINNQIKNIFLEGFTVSNDVKINRNQVTIISEPTNTANQVYQRKAIFAIYVKNSDKETVISTAKKIRNTLLNYTGKVANNDTNVFFHRISILTEPYLYSTTESKDVIFLIRFEALLNDTETNTIYV